MAAVMGAGVVLAVAAAAAPLFVSSGGAAALRDHVGASSSNFAGVRLAAGAPLSPDRLSFRRTIAETVTAGLPVGSPSLIVIGSDADLVAPETGKRFAIRLLTKPGFHPWVRVVEGSRDNQDGFWVAQTAAEALGLHPGSTATVELNGQSAPVKVAGVYRDLEIGPLPAFWTAVTPWIYTKNPDAPPLPPLLLGEAGPGMALEAKLLDQGSIEFDYPLRPGLTLTQARAAVARVRDLQSGGFDPSSPVNAAFTTVDSGLPTVVALADQTVAATTQPVQAISLAGRLVALVLVAAAGMYGVRRRQVEFDLLSSRGLGPPRLGVRSAVEAVLPMAMGAALGWWLATVLVARLGPGAVTDPAALRSSVTQVIWTAAAAIVLFGLVAGAATRNEARERPGRLKDAASRARWEIAALALAGASLYEILTRGAGASQTGGQPPKFDLLILLFPFLFVAGTAGVVVRWVQGMLPRMKAAGSRRSPWLYLATSRLANAPRLALSLVTASALALGILIYAGVLASSIQATATAKATLSIGSDVVLTVGALPVVEHDPPFPWTPIQRLTNLGISGTPNGGDLLTVQPSTFPATASWSSHLGPPMTDLMAKLHSTSGPLPVIVVGGNVADGAQLQVAEKDVPLHVVAHLKDFPGAPRGQITLVADRQSVVRVFPIELAGVENHFELWAKGNPSKILPVLRDQGFPMELLSTAAKVRTTPGFLALSWTFGLLEAFGVLAGAITVLGMVLYLQARQRTREVSYVLAKRMGLRPRAHERSVLVELLAMLVSALLLALVFATVAAALVHGRLDPIPSLPPSPFLSIPVELFGATLLGVVVSCLAGAKLVQRRADRAKVAEVMRLA
jgi:putative ABC transport system permease protein